MKALAVAALALALVSTALAASSDYTIRSDKKIGPLSMGRAKIIDAAGIFGNESAIRKQSDNVCVARWNTIGLSVSQLNLDAGNPCVNGGIVTATMTGSRWHTAPGLHIGNSLARLRQLYPLAKYHRAPNAGWWLIVRHACKEVGGSAFPGLLARTSGGKVSGLVVTLGVCE